MTANNVPDPVVDASTIGPNFRPFTDSILTDIACLPDKAQWVLFRELRARYSPTVRVEWGPLLLAIAIPLAVLAGWHRLHERLPDLWCGVIAGVAGMFAAEGLLIFTGSVHHVTRAWWLRRADRKRAQR